MLERFAATVANTLYALHRATGLLCFAPLARLEDAARGASYRAQDQRIAKEG